MKNLIIFSILTACVMSVAQTRDLSQLTAAELAKRTIVVYQDSQAKKVWILESKNPTTAKQIMQKEFDSFYRQQGKKTLNKHETLTGGWQPQLSDIAKGTDSKVAKGINEVAHMLGQECTQVNLGNWLQKVELETDEVIEINSLSAQAQDCLRR